MYNTALKIYIFLCFSLLLQINHTIFLQKFWDTRLKTKKMTPVKTDATIFNLLLFIIQIIILQQYIMGTAFYQACGRDYGNLRIFL
ncbi:hypothetical protein CLNEO_02010 [Anaerotignum neopropionicum]|uniref:Uncharacterized protein n=1 Tax=Anaerotignum neopropionicum TaxID=36847 RepID=A0A136WHT6_9FIRM|nr:hypothetical protein CLNEO_02010 [Anaerotignum neopropionicum]